MICIPMKQDFGANEHYNKMALLVQHFTTLCHTNNDP